MLMLTMITILICVHIIIYNHICIVKMYTDVRFDNKMDDVILLLHTFILYLIFRDDSYIYCNTSFY